MRAVGYQRSLPPTDEESLVDIQLPDPVATGRDLLVSVRAVAVNPIDTKVRRRAEPAPGEWSVLGFDASGVVVGVGSECTLFSVGDEVFYAGWAGRSGSNAELQLVDERVVGPKPSTLDFASAAAMPLTTLTAWEMLFDRLSMPRDGEPVPSTLLVVGAAGGVGSMAVQLARQLTAFTVLGTASRPVTREWVLDRGAHHVVDHGRPLATEVRGLHVPPVDVVFSTTQTDRHWSELAELIAPQGRIGLIDDPEPVDIRLLKQKSVSVHWEQMATRPKFGTADMVRQHEILSEAAELVDQGVLRSTMTESFGVINAANLRRAHAQLESGTTRGKVVLADWSS
ncbi:MAG: zinc-binding alcohol dehydrogenase family protein [Candidatus Nanopelagicales bacterium]